ncbi:MAG: glycosyltransferase [Leptolyngbyaceae cyanobacterium bins.349]|nr:glycosyltransferase [Leptolyngbyaceae cyanobacterium bins.349]
MENSLLPLPYSVYFVRDDAELCQQLARVTTMPPFEQFYRAERGGSSSWIVQTYLQLKCRGLDVHLVPRFIPGAICVVSREELMKRHLWKSLPFQSYLVVCQQDRPRPAICEHRIVQNRLNVLTERDHYMPHWSQPDLQVRQPERGDRLQNLVFKGRWYYLPEAYKSEAFIAQLQAIGIQFSTDADYHVDLQAWTDYATADGLLAVRQRSDQYLESKPPTKLINAWMAGCPALLGPEPAYQELRRSELDYLEVHSPEDVIQALQQLQAEPKRYRAMIENGWQRAKEFTPDHLAQQWRDLLAGPIAQGYEQWRHGLTPWLRLDRPFQFSYRLLRQELERRHFNQVTGRKR